MEHIKEIIGMIAPLAATAIGYVIGTARSRLAYTRDLREWRKAISLGMLIVLREIDVAPSLQADIANKIYDNYKAAGGNGVGKALYDDIVSSIFRNGDNGH